ncbi:juvenile hormone acid O-methyltransferase [Rhipicephalus sanguineus]|uniref:juvenile hormone acid O-methyltransferase n=1 Tax=Rhipicephalus sanguineus TaxID=34632 RepID=UPI001895E669|nr:juvenile hormone acid O-methyltransferase [Rhipicephalus sanguineus]
MDSVPELVRDNVRRSVAELKSAELYSLCMEGHWQRSANALDAFKNAFAPTHSSYDNLSELRFLDVGCGEGSFTLRHLLPRCQDQCCKLVAVDNSAAMLDYAKSHNASEKIDYIHFDILEGDVDGFLKKHGPFARVYTFNLLHWIKDKVRAMKNIEKLTAPGGECFVVFENCIPMFDVFRTLAESVRWEKYAEVLLHKVPATAGFTDMNLMRSHLEHVMKKTGLKTLTCEVLRSPAVSITDLNAATGLIASYNPIYAHLCAEDKQQLIKSTADILADRAQGIAEGTISNHQFTYVVHAYKPALLPTSSA